MGLRATLRVGFEHMHVLALVYWHHMHAARLFLAFIHECPLRARSGPSGKAPLDTVRRRREFITLVYQAPPEKFTECVAAIG